MKCIECQKEMKDKSYWYYGIGDWDMDYPATHHEEYRCKECKIKYVNGEWIVPKNIELPTEKQVNTILFINNKCGLAIKPITKKQCIRDIGKYFDKAKEVADRPYYDDDYDDEHYCHCDPYLGNI
jgi:hypothetical protein